jgi:hypothetical protein
MKTLFLIASAGTYYPALYKVPMLIAYTIMPNLPKYLFSILYSIVFLWVEVFSSLFVWVWQKWFSPNPLLSNRKFERLKTFDHEPKKFDLKIKYFLYFLIRKENKSLGFFSFLNPFMDKEQAVKKAFVEKFNANILDPTGLPNQANPFVEALDLSFTGAQYSDSRFARFVNNFMINYLDSLLITIIMFFFNIIYYIGCGFAWFILPSEAFKILQASSLARLVKTKDFFRSFTIADHAP